MPKTIQPGPGQGMLFPETEHIPENQIVDDFAFEPSDFDAPATSLGDYYATLHRAVTAIGAARSKERGFSRLSPSSEPVKEYAYRREEEPDTAQKVVVKSARRDWFRAQDALTRRNVIEYDQLTRFAKATGAYTLEEVFEYVGGLPPAVTEIEHKYFPHTLQPSREEDKHFRAKRAQLARRARRYKTDT